MSRTIWQTLVFVNGSEQIELTSTKSEIPFEISSFRGSSYSGYNLFYFLLLLVPPTSLLPWLADSLNLAVKVGRFVYVVFFICMCIGASTGNRLMGSTSTFFLSSNQIATFRSQIKTSRLLNVGIRNRFRHRGSFLS
jgi:hypothetical protein